MKTISVYCGTYAKYNAGDLSGAWLDLSEYVTLSGFLQACHDLHKDEEDPEFMFQDIDNETDINFSGEPSIADCGRFIEFLNLPEADQEILEGYASLYGLSDNIEEQLEEALDAYCGTYDTMADYAEELTREGYKIPDFLEGYVDWQAMARDMRVDHMQADNGMVFRSY